MANRLVIRSWSLTCESSMLNQLLLIPFEYRSNLPFLLVNFQWFLGVAIRNKDLKFWFSLLIFDFRPWQVARLLVDIIDIWKMFALVKFQIRAKPICLEVLYTTRGLHRNRSERSLTRFTAGTILEELLVEAENVVVLASMLQYFAIYSLGAIIKQR